MIFTGENILEFTDRFHDDMSCLSYLSDIKWSDGYTCKKCGHTKHTIRKKNLARDCNRCHHIESPTVNTLFHRVRFPIQKAFYMVYLIVSRDGRVKIDELENAIDLRRATCWNFKKKVDAALEELKKKSKEKIQWENLVMVKPKPKK